MKRLIVAVAIFLVIAAGTALAETSPVGQWDYRAFNEPNLTAVKVKGICFVADGTWYSTTFAGWSGLWFQKGDRIRFYGTSGSVSTADFGQFFNKDKFSGEFAHFFTSPFNDSTKGSFVMTRTSLICDAPASPAYPSASGDPSLE